MQYIREPSSNVLASGKKNKKKFLATCRERDSDCPRRERPCRAGAKSAEGRNWKGRGEENTLARLKPELLALTPNCQYRKIGTGTRRRKIELRKPLPEKRSDSSTTPPCFPRMGVRTERGRLPDFSPHRVALLTRILMHNSRRYFAREHFASVTEQTGTKAIRMQVGGKKRESVRIGRPEKRIGFDPLRATENGARKDCGECGGRA